MHTEPVNATESATDAPAERLLTLFHAPNTRSTGALILLEEIGEPFDLELINLKTEEQRSGAFLAINPMGKVPALLHGTELVTEQVAILLYLADLFPKAGLAPAFDDPLRAPYLRWMVFYGTAFEPAVVDRARKVEPGDAGMSPYGNFDTMFKTLTDQLERGPYLLGERFSAADVLWGTALAWILKAGLVPESDSLWDYVERINARPAVVSVRDFDTKMAADFEKEAKDKELLRAQAEADAAAAETPPH